jgi:hypothetical protein
MNKKLFLNLILIFTFTLVNGQNALWTKSTASRLSTLQQFERTSTPSHAEFYTLNLEAMKSLLQTAPTRDFSGTPIVCRTRNYQSKFENLFNHHGFRIARNGSFR